MQQIVKIFVLAAALLVGAFFANYYGVISIPWLDVNHVTTYGDDANRSNEAIKKAFEE